MELLCKETTNADTQLVEILQDVDNDDGNDEDGDALVSSEMVSLAIHTINCNLICSVLNKGSRSNEYYCSHHKKNLLRLEFMLLP